ncbi:hypothetical protein CRG98_032606 [Punica granatum]|uniref:Uncharacterized protein n=1 Tax=Punica granatum TaxID=22663 RepID=A0A2I0ISJ8_PUNGR|nr:hypothetical protein CRG98_032606 [Punica granatum]
MSWVTGRNWAEWAGTSWLFGRGDLDWAALGWAVGGLGSAATGLGRWTRAGLDWTAATCVDLEKRTDPVSQTRSTEGEGRRFGRPSVWQGGDRAEGVRGLNELRGFRGFELRVSELRAKTNVRAEGVVRTSWGVLYVCGRAAGYWSESELWANGRVAGFFLTLRERERERELACVS